MGVLTPAEPGERRSFVVVFPILTANRADLQTANGEWSDNLRALIPNDEPAPTRAPLILVTEGGDPVNAVTGELVQVPGASNTGASGVSATGIRGRATSPRPR